MRHLHEQQFNLRVFNLLQNKLIADEFGNRSITSTYLVDIDGRAQRNQRQLRSRSFAVLSVELVGIVIPAGCGNGRRRRHRDGLSDHLAAAGCRMVGTREHRHASCPLELATIVPAGQVTANCRLNLCAARTSAVWTGQLLEA